MPLPVCSLSNDADMSRFFLATVFLLWAFSAQAFVLDQTSHRLEYVLEAIDAGKFTTADENTRDAEWFKWAREADREAKARVFHAQFFSAAGITIPKCPQPGDSTDGCATSAGTWQYPTPCFGAGGALQGSLTFYNGFSRPAWNVVGCDYPTGATTTKAQMLANAATYDPAVQSWPSGCTYSATGWPYNTAMPWVDCLNSTGTAGTLTIQNLYLGAAFGHKSVGIRLSRSVKNVVSNIIIDNDADISSVTQVGGLQVGLINLQSGAHDVSVSNVTANGHFNDGTGCCDTAFGVLMELSTSTAISFDQVVFDNFQQYSVGLLGTNHTLSVTRSVINGCMARTPPGHTECWFGSTNYGTGTVPGITYSYNVLFQPPGYGNHEEFMHITNTGPPDGAVNGFVMDHNIEIGNPTSPANGQGVAGIQFQLINGTFALTAAFPANISWLTTGTEIYQAINPNNSTQTNTVLSLWAQNGSNAYGPTFQTDCGSNQANTVWCPTGGSQNVLNYNNTTTVAPTTGGKLSTNSFNYFHDWSRGPMSGTVSIHDNYVYLVGILATGGWQRSPSDCTGITSGPFGSNNINLLDGSSLSSWTAPIGTGC